MTFEEWKNTPVEILEKETECKKLAIDARIREVGGAISRYDSSTQSIKQVKVWAEELLAYCEAVDTIEHIQKIYKDGYIPF